MCRLPTYYLSRYLRYISTIQLHMILDIFRDILLPKISVNNILFLPNIIFYYIFRSLILPIFRQNEEAIDKVVKQGQQKITEIAEKAEKTLQENKND